METNKKIILEHSGDEYYTELAKKLQAVLEFEYDLDVEQVIGDSKEGLDIKYQEPGGETFMRLTTIKSMPSKTALSLYLKLGL